MLIRAHAKNWLKKLIVAVVVELVTALVHTALAGLF